MKFFGNKSLSSVIRIILEVFWYLIILHFVSTAVVFFLKKDIRDTFELFEFSNLIFKIDQSINIPWYTYLLNIPGMIFTLFLVRILCNIFISFKKEEVFTVKNFVRLRLIAIGIIIIGAVDTVTAYYKIKILNNLIKIQNAVISPSSIFWSIAGTFFIGLILLVMAEFFKKAAELKEDSDLTI